MGCLWVFVGLFVMPFLMMFGATPVEKRVVKKKVVDNSKEHNTVEKAIGGVSSLAVMVFVLVASLSPFILQFFYDKV